MFLHTQYREQECPGAPLPPSSHFIRNTTIALMAKVHVFSYTLILYSTLKYKIYMCIFNPLSSKLPYCFKIKITAAVHIQPGGIRR